MVRTDALLDGSSRQCKSCALIRYIIRSGEKYGEYTVLDAAVIKHGRDRSVHCRCSCGRERNVRISRLMAIDSMRCCNHCVQRFNRFGYGEAALLTLVTEYKRGAEKRGYDWQLNLDECELLFNQICYYCGKPPTQIRNSGSNYGSYIYNGIDRMDNTKGYIQSNVVSCCKTCNTAKSNLTLQVFVDMAYNIVALFGRNGVRKDGSGL